MLLIVLLVFGLGAVAIGNVVAQIGARRPLRTDLRFTEAPPAVLATPSLGVPPRDTTAALRPPARRPRQWRRPTASTGLFVVTFVLYSAVGGVLVLHYGSTIGDAFSRLSNAYYVFYSRDPHLAAVGFVWNPLPSIAVMPLFVFKSVWPALTKRAFAMSLESAAFMAGAAVQMRLMFRDLDVRRASANVLLVAFILNPMVIYYAANGMSEAPYLFFLILAVRYLAQWLRRAELRPLVLGGVALGLCYLVRYEVAAAAPIAALLVAAVTFGRSAGARRQRIENGIVDATVFIIPFVAAFIGWAVLSFVITGHPFEQFSSQYGNASQISATGGTGTADLAGIPAPVFGILQALAFAPLLPLFFGSALVRGLRRRDLRVFALVIFVAVLGFSWFEFVTGGTYPWFRYYIPAVPLSLLSIALLINQPGSRLPRRGTWGQRTAQAVAAATAMAIVVAPGLATTTLAMNSATLGAIEQSKLAWVVNDGHATTLDERIQQSFFPSVNSITRDIDSHHFGSGSVLVDTFSPCAWAIFVITQHPHQFVITSDRDFQRAVSDPYSFHVRYILVPPNGGYGGLDAINREFPTLYDNGARFAHEVKQYNTVGCPPFRLFRVDRSAQTIG